MRGTAIFSCVVTVTINLKVFFLFIKGALSSLRWFLVTESPLKMMKNAFYFTSKALFVFKISKFLSWHFVHVTQRLDKNDKVNFKFYDITAWWHQPIAIHIFSNISRSKDNQAMKFGQLIECNMRNIFLEKSYTKCGGQTSLRPFSKKLRMCMSLN